MTTESLQALLTRTAYEFQALKRQRETEGSPLTAPDETPAKPTKDAKRKKKSKAKDS